MSPLTQDAYHADTSWRAELRRRTVRRRSLARQDRSA